MITTLTIPLKPLEGTAVKLTCTAGPPAASVMLPGVFVRLKSPTEVELRLQDDIKIQERTAALTRTNLSDDIYAPPKQVTLEPKC